MNPSRLTLEPGPLEATPFPTHLKARVVTPGAHPRAHGYDVEQDLARHYGFVDLCALFLTGQLPPEEHRRALEVALMVYAPVSVAHASVHSTVLARLCGATSTSLIAVAAVGLSEQARLELQGVQPLLRWLRHPQEPLPDAYRAHEDAERAAVADFLSLLPDGWDHPILGWGPNRRSLLVALLHGAGFRRLEQMEAWLTLARLPCALAEGFAERPANFANYPINLPSFEYSDDGPLQTDPNA